MSTPPEDLPPLAFRAVVRPEDIEDVQSLVRATGFFSDEEVSIATELVEQRLAKGPASGYEFIFTEQGGSLIGYTCYGRVPLTRSSFDLYWIVVAPTMQGMGVGRRLLAETERAVVRTGGTTLYAETSSRDQYAPTRSFYRASGYSVAAELSDFYAPGDSKIVFVKRLA